MRRPFRSATSTTPAELELPAANDNESPSVEPDEDTETQEQQSNPEPQPQESCLVPPRFILPCWPVLRDRPPSGAGWLHEVKFDGYRVQLHKDGGDIAIYSKNGADFTRRYPATAEALHSFPGKSLIVDGELVACDERGVPDFYALHVRGEKERDLCVWCFDLLALNGRDLRPLPLIARKTKLAKLLARTSHERLRYSEVFTDPEKLLAACEEHELEGIVSKKNDAPYRCGNQTDWIKVKSGPGAKPTKTEASCLSERPPFKDDDVK
jgi:bifunctional non-homologous end joining protein LigD